MAHHVLTIHIDNAPQAVAHLARFLDELTREHPLKIKRAGMLFAGEKAASDAFQRCIEAQRKTPRVAA